MKTRKQVQGIAVSSGYAMAPAVFIKHRRFDVIPRCITAQEIPKEMQRFQDALENTQKDISHIREQVEEHVGSQTADIFNAHILVLGDPALLSGVEHKLTNDLVNIEYAFSEVMQEYYHNFSKIDDPYLKERMSDLEDVGYRVLTHLMGAPFEVDWMNFEEPVVIVAEDLLPSDTAQINTDKVLGFVTASGSKTSHTAIVARSLNIPAIVGAKNIMKVISSGDPVIIDGVEGCVIVHPSEHDQDYYRNQIQNFKNYKQDLKKYKDLTSVTQDGHSLILQANIESPEDVDACLEHGANGIGLFRTEFLYMNRAKLPTEEEHFEIYKHVLESMKGFSVTVRTLDVGSDKLASAIAVPKEDNPALGWRAIRFCLEQEDVFRTQLRALLRASHFGQLRIMFPMIAGLEEWHAAKIHFEEVKQELRDKGIPFDENLLLGAMIETPSAAMTADVLAEEVDFFSIGTNDLIQYSLAVDRGNEKIASYYDPLHPAIVRFIKMIVDAGHDAGILVGMCGEMSSDPIYIELLIGMELDSLSVSQSVVPLVKKVIRQIHYKEAKHFAQEALTFKLGCDLEKYACSRLEKILQSERSSS